MTTEKIMFELIRSIVFEGEICEETLAEIKESLNEETLESLYKLSKAHDVANLVGAALSDNGLLSGNSDIEKKLKKEKLVAAFRCERLMRELDAITAALEEAEIDHIALKGSVIRDLYPAPWMRTSCDIDILVKEQDLDKAIDALVQKLSYTAEEKKGYHDISLHSPAGVHLELHFNINENMESIDRVLSKAWEYAAIDGDKKYCYALSCEYLYFHILAHAAYHFVHGGCGVRSFIDMMLIRKKLRFDSNKLEKLFEISELLPFASACDSMCRVWFDKAEHTELTLNMESYVMFGGVYGNTVNLISSARKKSKLSYTLSRIFMPYELLKTEYPVLEDHKILFPACQVARWLRVFDRSKAKRMRDEIKLNNSISDDKAEKTQNMLKELGLN